LFSQVVDSGRVVQRDGRLARRAPNPEAHAYKGYDESEVCEEENIVSVPR
jgi:hypothetical protein